ncbi:MAG: T9SS type A sorting domain-containing protein [Phaeodactylibacter sp.]|nr:T9SS type A sorting domain-containing protein [Phaeodactylibacter sp.]
MLIVFLFSLCFPLAGKAQQAGLDPNFGDGGRAFIDFSEQTDLLYGLSTQPDGKIILSGNTRASGFDLPLAYCSVARLNADGSLDQSFGAGGLVSTALSTEGIFANSHALQPDGKIVVAGSVEKGGGTGSTFAVLRFNTDGSPDTSFGDNGLSTTQHNDLAGFEEVAVLPDGKILVMGSAEGGQETDFVLARFLPDGSPDMGFGQGGLVFTDLGGNINIPSSMALQPDGKIILAGVDVNEGFFSGADLLLVRYNPDGSLDESFGNAGFVTAGEMGFYETAADIILLPDGKILTTGLSREGFSNTKGIMARFLNDGSLDTSFGDGGFFQIAYPGGEVTGVALVLQPNKKVIMIGSLVGALDMVLGRFNPDGSLDTAFGEGGFLATSDFGDPRAASLTADGKLLVGGDLERIPMQIESVDFALAQYELGDISTSVKTIEKQGLILGQNFPNPVRTTTTIPFELAERKRVSLKVFNARGQEAAALLDEILPAGPHQITWDSKSLAPGVYYYRLQAGREASRSLTLLKQ